MEAFYDQTGAPPTVRQVAEKMGVRSSSTAYGFLRGLETKGYLYSAGKRGFIPSKELSSRQT